MLSESTVRRRVKRFFKIGELVGVRTEKKYGQRAWRFLDYRLLYAVLIIRTELGKEITVNTKRLKQRGLRTIVQQLVKNFFYKDRLYISAHLLGKGVDFDVKGMSAEQVRRWIRENEHLFPFKIRLEAGVSWVHLDVIWEEKNPRVYLFRV